jgi:hypothetical protein
MIATMQSHRCNDEIWCYRSSSISFDYFHYGLTVILLSTWATPGAHHAALSASWRSAHDRTVPLRMISLPLVSTVMWLASNSALRRKASSILRLISMGATRGLTWIMLETPLTPRTRRTACSALDRW